MTALRTCVLTGHDPGAAVRQTDPPLDRIVVRELRPAEAPYAIDTVFAGLSARSRYLRFHSPVPRLTAGLRNGLLDLDGRTRTAVVALLATPDGPQPVGIARIAGPEGGRAEGAVAVVDEWQRRGIGRRLITAVTALATGLGYTEMSATILSENAAMLGLARSVLPWSRRFYDGEVVQLLVPLGPAAPTITDEDVLADLLSS